MVRLLQKKLTFLNKKSYLSQKKQSKGVELACNFFYAKIYYII